MSSGPVSDALSESSEEEHAKIISSLTSKLEELGAIPLTPSSHSSSPISSNNTNGHESTSTDTKTNTLTTPQTPASPTLEPSTEVQDLVCIGFGPASLAIAIALSDACLQSNNFPPKCLYLEKQKHFAWHAGMQLPSAKMQISFLKDLATPRNPTSRFTFLNYLFTKSRMDHFINLGTFLPSRREYDDYLKWCASEFEERGEVNYGVEVTDVLPCKRENDKVVTWEIIGSQNGHPHRWEARQVVIAVGGKAAVPQNLTGVENIFHSSEYAYRISEIEKSRKGLDGKLRFAVVGSGQSAAEIFNDLWDRFPESEVKLVMRGRSLRPSDDSPFVNEIFSPSHVSTTYALPPTVRAAAINEDRSTNYGVVRLELLEQLYEKMYHQRITDSDEQTWRCKILPERIIDESTKISSGIKLKISAPDQGNMINQESLDSKKRSEEIEVDYLFTATGYKRNAHESILSKTTDLLSASSLATSASVFPVAGNYRVQYDPSKVDVEKSGIWLQGCNEATHGLSDTLLSILAVRGGQLVESMFGKDFETISREKR